MGTGQLLFDSRDQPCSVHRESNITHPLIRSVDLVTIAATREVNYLHFGNAINFFQTYGSVCREANLLALLEAHAANDNELATLLRHYKRTCKKGRSFQLRRDFQRTIFWRKQFSALDCRGFSYWLDLAMRGYNSQLSKRYNLAAAVNLRVALVPRPQLFYPRRVREHLRRVSWTSNHYFHQYKYPSIAICFGKKTPTAWYILTLQSDISSGTTPLNEHFRGWRNVLFANIVAQAYGKVSRVYMCRAEDVERTCYPGTLEKDRVRERWRNIYDRTAADWGMPLVFLTRPVDIQLYDRPEPIFVDRLYELRLDSGENDSIGRGDSCTALL